MFKKFVPMIGLGISLLILTSCVTNEGNIGNMSTYAIPPNGEAQWIRNGEPIDFEENLWYPQDEVDTLLDSEVVPMGEYRSVQFFVETTDVRPLNQLYTKFGRNKFRVYRPMKSKVSYD